MSVLKLKPHRLSYKVSQGGYEDGLGDYHEGESSWVGCIECDAVPQNGQANEIKFEDGTTHRYSHIVYLPSNVREFSIGERVRITLLGGAVRYFTVKGFQRYQLQCKLWV